VLVALLGHSSLSPAQEWTLAAKETPVAGATDVLETRFSTARSPGGAFDRVGLHRYRTSAPARAALLYLPGTNMNGVLAVSDEDHNLWVFLARRGVEVYTLDYRTNAVPASAAAGELGVMRGWGMDVFVADIRAAAAQARQLAGRERLFVAGFSRGVSLAYAFAASEPEAVAGIIALDGSFKSHSPKGRYDHAAESKELEASGQWASDVSGRMGWEARQKLMQAAGADPTGRAPDAKYASLGDQLAEILYSAWRPGGLANAKGGLSKPQVLAKLLGSYDRYYPAVQTLDGQSIADYDDDPRTRIDDLWGEMKTPILSFTCTGMGGDWILNSVYSADKSGSPDVTLNVLERYGHLDVIVGERARAEVFEPTLAWIDAHSKP
jgi:alpha-beta hydrolase superfamily lysophospholipase